MPAPDPPRGPVPASRAPSPAAWWTAARWTAAWWTAASRRTAVVGVLYRAEAPGGMLLLDGAAAYATAAMDALGPPELPLPTPCAGWDLAALLCHLSASADALAEGLGTGRIAPAPERAADPPGAGACGPPVPPPVPPPVRRTGAVRVPPVAPAAVEAAARIGILQTAGWRSTSGADGGISVGGRPLGLELLLRAGALELTVHGWDIRRARHGGPVAPPPAALADRLLPVVPLLVPAPADRGTLFAAPVPVPGTAEPGARLLAALGRSPY